MGIGFRQLLKRKPGVLSGGEKQRVAIARALVRNPHLFLLDEPLSNLDAKLRAQTRSELKRLLQRFNITSIYVTHDQTEAVALADRIAVMREGRIEQVGTFNWLTHNPANAFVAGFVGSPPMNLFTGVVDRDQLFVGDIAIPLPDKLKPRLHPGRRVTVGVRPEVAQVTTEETTQAEGLRLQGTVEVVEPDFAHRNQFVHLRTGRLSYAALSELDPPLRIGDEVDIMFPAQHFYFFDGESEERIE
jgi:ABC-type sugar transport system ATPase subunit